MGAQQSQGDQEMTDHKCPRCGMELKVVEVQVPVCVGHLDRNTMREERLIVRYETREEVADCPRCTGAY